MLIIIKTTSSSSKSVTVIPTKSLAVCSPPTNPADRGISSKHYKDVIGGGQQIRWQNIATEFPKQRCKGILSIVNCHIIITTGRRCLQVEGVKPTDKIKKITHCSEKYRRKPGC